MTRDRTPQQAARARRLQDLGVPLEFDEDQCNFVLIRERGKSFAVELRCGATGFLIDVSITSGLPNLGISYSDLTVPWPDPNFYWLDDPVETGGRYRIPGDKRWFQHDEVINHNISNVRRTIRRGRSIEGLLLGFGGRIPAEFKHGMYVPARLTVFDQFDLDYPAEVELWVDRSESLMRPKSLRPKREPIFGVHDEIHK